MPRSRKARKKKGVRLARVEGFEPPAPGLEGLCSIQLSYTRQVMVASSKLSGDARSEITVRKE